MKNKKSIQISLIVICLILLTSLAPVLMSTDNTQPINTPSLNSDLIEQPISSKNDTAPMISDPVPSDGEVNVSIALTHLEFTLTDPQGLNMSYTVETSPDIGSDAAVDVVNGTYLVNISNLTYATTYNWTVTVTNINLSLLGETVETFSFTTEDEPYSELSVVITKPELNSFYFNDKKYPIIQLDGRPFAYGPITLEAEVSSVYEVEKVEFIITNPIRKSIYSANKTSEGTYSFHWKLLDTSSPLIGLETTIEVRVTDSQGNTANDSIDLFKWRIHPVLFVTGAAFLLNPNTKLVRSPQGYTIVRGLVFNPRVQGRTMTFRAIRLHYTKVGLFQTENGVLIGNRCSVNTNSPNVQISMGPFGMVSWVFITYRGTSLEQPGLFQFFRK